MTALNTRAIMFMVENKEKGLIHGKLKTKLITNTNLNLFLYFSLGQTEVSMKEIGKTTKYVAKASILGQMEGKIKKINVKL